MIQLLKETLSRIFKISSIAGDNVFEENWDWDDGWSHKQEKREQWDFYTIYIFINEKSLIDQIVHTNKKYSIFTPYLHITLHYPFTIKEGYSEDDIFRVLTQFFSKYECPTFSIKDTLWLHKNRNKPGNIIALGIDQSGDFEEIRLGLTQAIHPYIVATAPWELDPQYKTKARPHISIAYRLNYHIAKLLFDKLKEQQRNNDSNSIFRTYPMTTITLGKKKVYFDYDFQRKCWKQY